MWKKLSYNFFIILKYQYNFTRESPVVWDAYSVTNTTGLENIDVLMHHVYPQTEWTSFCVAYLNNNEIVANELPADGMHFVSSHNAGLCIQWAINVYLYMHIHYANSCQHIPGILLSCVQNSDIQKNSTGCRTASLLEWHPLNVWCKTRLTGIVLCVCVCVCVCVRVRARACKKWCAKEFYRMTDKVLVKILVNHNTKCNNIRVWLRNFVFDDRM